MLGDLLAAALNPNVGAWALSPAATEIEAQTVRWIAELIGYPADCGGLLVSGGNMANIVCFLAARAAHGRLGRARDGIAGGAGPPAARLRSTETHTWIQKAADMCGLGTDAIRWIPTDADLRMDVAGAAAASRQTSPAATCRSWSWAPRARSAPAPSIRCARSPRSAGKRHLVSRRRRVRRIRRGGARSAGRPARVEPGGFGGGRSAQVAVRAARSRLRAGARPEALRAAFAYHPPYYHFEERATNYVDYGPQNSRGFRALKVWLALRQAGAAATAR